MPNVTVVSYLFHKLEQQVCHPDSLNGGKVTNVTKVLKDSIDCRALTLQKGFKGFKEEKAQAGSSFHWAFTVHCLNDSSSMPKLMNSVISAQIKNDHAFFRRVSEIGEDFIPYKDVPLGLTVFIYLIYYHSKAESCSADSCSQKLISFSSCCLFLNTFSSFYCFLPHLQGYVTCMQH